MVRSNNRFFIPTTAVAVFLIFYSWLLSLGARLLQDPDTFWHIRTGQWILDHLQLPTTDFYSYTEIGKPWISTEWLSEVFYAIAFKFGGWRAVTALAVTSCAVIVGLLCFYLLRHLRFSVAIGLTVLTGSAMSLHFVARPHLFSYVLLTIWIISLLDAYDDDNFKLPSVLTLTPLMILWANLHGSFTFGLALLYVFAGFCVYKNIAQHNYAGCWRSLAVASVVTASICATPYGISPVFMTIKLFEMKPILGRFIDEWRPPNFQVLGFHLIYFVAILTAIAGLGIRLRGPRLIVFSMITFLGLSYIRGIAMFYLLVPIILARPAAQCVRYLAPQLSGTNFFPSENGLDPVLRFLRKRSYVILAGSTALAVLMTVWTCWRKDVIPSNAITPKAAIDFVQRANISGHVFNTYNFGGYLIFSGIPTFVDGRAELFGDAFLRKYFDTVDLVDFDAAFAMLDEYKVHWVILAPEQALAKALARSASWDEVFSDKYAVVFVRRSSLQ